MLLFAEAYGVRERTGRKDGKAIKGAARGRD